MAKKKKVLKEETKFEITDPTVVLFVLASGSPLIFADQPEPKRDYTYAAQ